MDIYACEKCGSANVTWTTWATANGNIPTSFADSPTDQRWCENCDSETRLIKREATPEEIIELWGELRLYESAICQHIRKYENALENTIRPQENDAITIESHDD